jgi:hypothetical protein
MSFFKGKLRGFMMSRSTELRSVIFSSSITLNNRIYDILRFADMPFFCDHCKKIETGFLVITKMRDNYFLHFLLFQSDSMDCHAKITIFAASEGILYNINQQIDQIEAANKAKINETDMYWYTTSFDSRSECITLLSKMLFLLKFEPSNSLTGFSFAIKFDREEKKLIDTGKIYGQYTIEKKYEHKDQFLHDFSRIYPNVQKIETQKEQEDKMMFLTTLDFTALSLDDIIPREIDGELMFNFIVSKITNDTNTMKNEG